MNNFDALLSNMKKRLDYASNCVEGIQAQSHNFFLSHKEQSLPRPDSAQTIQPTYEVYEDDGGSDNDGESSSSYRQQLVEEG